MMQATIQNEEDLKILHEEQRLISVGVLVESVSVQTGQRCTPQMINNYEKHGLIRHTAETKGGFRLFTIQDIQSVICIKNLQTQGMSLAQIKTRMQDCPEEVKIDESALELPEDRRTQILKAAARVFPQNGYEATSIQDVAKEANISPSMIYQYFENKENLFLAFLESISFSKAQTRIHLLLDDHDGFSYVDVRRALIEVALQFSREHENNAEFFRLLISSERKFPELGLNFIQRFIAPREELIEHYFNQLVEKGIFRPVNTKHAVKVFFGIWANISIIRDMHFGKGAIYIPDEQEFGELVDLFLAGMFINSPRKT